MSPNLIGEPLGAELADPVADVVELELDLVLLLQAAATRANTDTAAIDILRACIFPPVLAVLWTK
jgi:hypothetical protein